MKSLRTPRHSVRIAAVSVTVAGSLSLGVGAGNIRWTWDTPGELDSWGTAWGQAQTVQDPSQDNTGNGGGSIYISTDYSVEAGDPPTRQDVITVMGNYGPWLWNSYVLNNLLSYSSLEFDIKWDAASTISVESFNTAGGDNGMVIWTARSEGDPADPLQWEIQFGRFDMPTEAADGWTHVSIPINPTTADLDRSVGIVFKKWVPQAVADLGGTAAFWIDNVELIPRTTPIAPPKVALTRNALEGLNLITLAGSQWQRQGIRTVGEDFSWVGSGSPTTYEFSVREMPDSVHAGFSAHIFLIPGDLRDHVDPDWNKPDAIRFDLGLQADGSGVGAIRYKTNSPESFAAMFGGAGELGDVTSSTTLGTWGFTFNDDTGITLFSPEQSVDVALPIAAAAQFDNSVTVYFGCMANNDAASLGQKVVLGQVRILGAKGGLDVTDNFTGPLDTATWEPAAEYPSGVIVVDDAAARWLSWSLPDSGFRPQGAEDILGPWTTVVGSTAPLPTGESRSVLIDKVNLPGTDAGYFRMNKPVFSKLQILLPGETAAPGTPTGKTGIPDPQQQYAFFEVTVNAVADDWYLIPSASDIVRLTTTDTDPILPPDTALINGTITLQVNLGIVGTQTFTVSDVTNPAIPPETSSGVVIYPP